MRNIKLTMEYDGSRYQGWQRLGKGESTNTIANKVIEVIKKMTNKDVELFCGSRTEVGVHASGQVANFKTTTDMKTYEIRNYLNRYLPMDIAVTDIEEKPERFHAALNAVSRTYMYRIAIADVPSVFDRKYTFHSFKKPDIDAMRKAALLLVGRHDFSGFTTAKRTKSSEKEIQNIDIYGDDEEIQITIEATDFLHNMTRMLMSTLLEVGLGNLKSEDIEAILEPAKKKTAPAPCDPKGLILLDVKYA